MKKKISSYEKAQDVIDKMIYSGTEFTLEDVQKLALKEANVLRISIYCTVNQYIKELREIGVIKFKPNLAHPAESKYVLKNSESVRV